MLIESGGDNLAATFSSPELADITIYVIDISAGDKIPSRGGPGITRSDLLVINKVDLAPHVGASLEKMDTDARRMRGTRPFVMTNMKIRSGSTPSLPSSKPRAASRQKPCLDDCIPGAMQRSSAAAQNRIVRGMRRESVMAPALRSGMPAKLPLNAASRPGHDFMFSQEDRPTRMLGWRHAWIAL